jgi:hypothetical protein
MENENENVNAAEKGAMEGVLTSITTEEIVVAAAITVNFRRIAA